MKKVETYFTWVEWAHGQKSISHHRPIYVWGPGFVDMTMGRVTFYLEVSQKHYWHRLDGPAYIDTAGALSSYWIDNERISEENYWSHPLVVSYSVLKIINEVLSE